MTDDIRETVHALRALGAIADTGSFVAASKRLQLTASAVSKVIARAESRLGVRLVQRTTRRVQLTEAATEYLKEGRALLGQLTALEDALVERTTSVKGLVRVAAPSMYGALAVAPVLAAVQQEHPHLRIDLRCDDRLVDLVAEGIDFAIRFLPQPPAGVYARVLHDDVRALFAAPGYLRQRPAPTRIADLSQHALLRYGPGAGPLVWTFGVDHEPVRATPHFSSDSIIAVREATLAGVGIAELPVAFAARHVAEGRLVEVLPGTVPTRRRVYAVYLSRRMPSRVRTVLDALATSLQSAWAPKGLTTGAR